MHWRERRFPAAKPARMTRNIPGDSEVVDAPRRLQWQRSRHTSNMGQLSWICPFRRPGNLKIFFRSQPFQRSRRSNETIDEDNAKMPAFVPDPLAQCASSSHRGVAVAARRRPRFPPPIVGDVSRPVPSPVEGRLDERPPRAVAISFCSASHQIRQRAE